MNRRNFLASLAALFAAQLSPRIFAAIGSMPESQLGNFRYIYSNPALRGEFLDFLTNVFHLFPEQEFHQVLSRLSQSLSSDKDIYEALQIELDEIKPFLGAFRYAIPALAKQKKVMAEQTLSLVDAGTRYDGHMEIGSTGRYLSVLEDELDITGEIFLLHNQAPGYGPEDIVERGQLSKLGTFVDMGDYSSAFSKTIPEKSLDMVTCYIGFHHCPLHKREQFISSVRNVLRPGGVLILRDHDAHNEDAWRTAALAHDTFNAGTDQSWTVNEGELRNFYSLEFIVDYLGKLGLKHEGPVLFQDGDPTRNGLLRFTRV